MSETGRDAVGSGSLEHDVRTADIETSSEAYTNRFRGAVGAWFLDVQANAVRDLLADAGAGQLSVLDVGGGHGQLTERFLADGHRVVTHGSRPICHARLAHLGSRIGRVSSDLWHLPFPDATFDIVVGIRLLAHVEDWRQLLEEMTRVSRRFVLVDFPARGPQRVLASALFGAKRKLEGDTRPYFDYEQSEVESALVAQGLRICQSKRQFALPMALHRGMRSARISALLEAATRTLGITARLGSPIVLLSERESGAESIHEPV